jgi:hypothetical protein
MSISGISSSAALPFAIAATGQAPNPQLQQAQVNAQADLLQAMRGVDLSFKLAVNQLTTRLSAQQGLDAYL